MSSGAKQKVHLAHSIVFTCNTHLSTWNTNTCESGTHICVHVEHTHKCSSENKRVHLEHIHVSDKNTHVCTREHKYMIIYVYTWETYMRTCEHKHVHKGTHTCLLHT